MRIFRVFNKHIIWLMMLLFLVACEGIITVKSPIRPLKIEAINVEGNTGSSSAQTISQTFIDQPIQLQLNALTLSGQKILLKEVQWKLQDPSFGEITATGFFIPHRLGIAKVVGQVGTFTQTFDVHILSLSPSLELPQQVTLPPQPPSVNPGSGIPGSDGGGGGTSGGGGEHSDSIGDSTSIPTTPIISQPTQAIPASGSGGGGGGGGSTPILAFTIKPTLKIATETVELAGPGAGFQLSVEVLDENGKAVQATIEWESLDSAIAVVTDTGMVIAKSQGTTFVTAKALGQEVKIPITVLGNNPVSGGSGGEPPPPPPPPAHSIISLSSTTGAAGSTITINGNHFGSSQGGSTVTVGGVTATINSWSDTGISVVVPGTLGLGTYDIAVTVSGQTVTQTGGYTVNVSAPPNITNINPNQGASTLSPVSVTGTNFGSSQGGSTITVGGVAATVNSWSNSSISIKIPTGLVPGAYNTQITVGGQNSNTPIFTVKIPVITNVNPNNGAPNLSPVILTGTDFGNTQGTSTLTVAGQAATINSWSDTSISIKIPTGVGAAGAKNVVVTVGGNASLAATFTVNAPVVASVTPTNGAPAQNPVTVAGTDFGSSQGTSSITVGGAAATVNSWSDTSISIKIPGTLANGAHAVVVTVDGTASNNTKTFSVNGPAITNVNGSQCWSGKPTDSISINGTDFGATQGKIFLDAGDQSASITNWTNTKIDVTVPAIATKVYALKVQDIAGNNSPTKNFLVRNASLSALPTTGGTITADTSFVITGTGFGCAKGTQLDLGGISSLANVLTTGVTDHWFDNAIELSKPDVTTVAGTNVTWAMKDSGGGAIAVTTPITMKPKVSTVLPNSQEIAGIPTKARVTGRGFNAGALINVTVQIFDLVGGNCDPTSPLGGILNALQVTTTDVDFAGTKLTFNGKCARVTVNGAASEDTKMDFP